MTLVDTNVLLDIATNDARWAAWSVQQLDLASVRGAILINAAIYAEFSVGYVRVEEIDKVLADVGLELAEIPRAALFLAGKVFQRYRARGGIRTAAPFFDLRELIAGQQTAQQTSDQADYNRLR